MPLANFLMPVCLGHGSWVGVNGATLSNWSAVVNQRLTLLSKTAFGCLYKSNAGLIAGGFGGTGTEGSIGSLAMVFNYISLPFSHSSPDVFHPLVTAVTAFVAEFSTSSFATFA